jgi:acetate---CoA ligase (ADP-forming)
MRAKGLEVFFEPGSVAVIGASSNPTKLGHAVLKNLVEGGYRQRGIVYPINPKAEAILGCRAYPSVLDVPDPIDLAVIIVPHPHVPPVLRACGQKGIPAAIVISAGFREAGMAGVERELELVAIAREFGIRIVGPNCLGVIDTFTPLNASFAAGAPPWAHGLHVPVGRAGCCHPRLGAGWPVGFVQVRQPGQQGRCRRDRSPGVFG